MKKMIQTLLCSVVVFTTMPAIAQKIDEERMQRDIAVAENVLGTLIKQQFEKQKMFFPLEIKSNYQPGYGVTFYIPTDYTTPIVFALPGDDNFIWDGPPGQRVYINQGNNENPNNDVVEPRAPEKKGTLSLQDKKKEKAKLDMDSIQDSYNTKVIDAAKTFLLDYGDMITQLSPTERIIVSNQGERQGVGKQIF